MPVDAYPLLFDKVRRARQLHALAEAYRARLLPSVREDGGGDGDLVVAPDIGRRLVERYVVMLDAYKRFNDYQPEARAGIDKVAALTALTVLLEGAIQGPIVGVASKVAAISNIGFAIESLRFILKLPPAFSVGPTAREFTFFAKTFYSTQNDLTQSPNDAVVAALVLACRLIHKVEAKVPIEDERGE